jgi:hypothetical protein
LRKANAYAVKIGYQELRKPGRPTDPDSQRQKLKGLQNAVQDVEMEEEEYIGYFDRPGHSSFERMDSGRWTVDGRQFWHIFNEYLVQFLMDF